MKYIKGAVFFVLGFLLATGGFLLGLIAWGEEFQHAAPLVSDGFFVAWFSTSVLVGGAGVWLGLRRRP